MTENNWHETKIRVRYKDTDRMGVVYYGNYLTFFEAARSEFMRDLGLPYTEIEKDGIFLAVTEAHAEYFGNVDYDAVVTVKARIVKCSPVRVHFVYEVVDETGRLLVTGRTKHACVNAEMKPVRMSREHMAVLEEGR